MEALRDELRNLPSAAEIALAGQTTPARVYVEREAKAFVTIGHYRGALLANPHKAERLGRLAHAGTALATAVLPETSKLVPSPTAAAGSALRHCARVLELAALAEADGEMTSIEAAEIRGAVAPAIAVLTAVTASADAAAGVRLL